MRNRSVKGKLAAVRTEDQVVDSHGNSGEFFEISAHRGHRVNIRGREFVIRLVDALCKEVDSRVVTAPDELAFVEIATGELHGFSGFIGDRRHPEYPNVLVALGVEVTGIVAAINGTANDVDVGFVFLFRLRLSGPCGILSGFQLSGLLTLRGILVAPCLLDVFRSRGAQKCYALAVGCPRQTRRAFGQITHLGGERYFFAA